MKQYGKYKESKNVWLGQVPEHWKLRFLFQCAEEKKISNKGMLDQNLLSLSYGNIIRKNIETTVGLLPESFETYQIVTKGDIILRLTDLQNDKRSLRTGLVTEKGIITSAYVCLEPKTDVNSIFLHYLLHSYDIKKLFYSLGGGLRQGCSYKDMKKISIPCPTPREQEQIVKYLDWQIEMIDRLVEQKRKEIELLKELIISLCYGGESDKQITVSEWCPKLPEGWKSVLGKRIFEERKEKGLTDEDMLAVTQNRGVVFKNDCNQNYVMPENTLVQKLVKSKDFVISLRSFQGGIEYSEIQGLVSPAYNVLYLKEKHNSQEMRAYYRFFFKSKPFISLLSSMGGGIRDGKNISFSDFSQIELPIPPKHILNEVYKLVQIYNKMNANLPSNLSSG